MGLSQFDNTVYLTADGVSLSGRQDRSAISTHAVEYFLLVVQNGVIARGKGGEISAELWIGEARTEQGQLSPGTALATAVAVVGTDDPPAVLTVSWSQTIELIPR